MEFLSIWRHGAGTEMCLCIYTVIPGHTWSAKAVWEGSGTVLKSTSQRRGLGFFLLEVWGGGAGRVSWGKKIPDESYPHLSLNSLCYAAKSFPFPPNIAI